MMRTDAVIAFATKNRFTLTECGELAKDLDAYNSMTFDLVGPKGRKPAKWTDAYYGFFELDGKLLAASQFKYVSDLHCENLAIPDKPSSKP